MFWLDPIALAQILLESAPAFALLPPVETFVEGNARGRHRLRIKKARGAQMEHHFGHAAGQKYLNCREILRAVGQRVHQAGDLAIHTHPVRNAGPLLSCRVRDGRQMQQEIGRTSKRCVHHHRIFEGGLGQDVLCPDAEFAQPQQSRRRSFRCIEPHRLARGRQCGMGQRQTESFGNHLRSGGGSEKLAASTWRGARVASYLRGILQSDLALGKACADGLNLPGVLSVLGQQRYAAGDEHRG